MSKKNQQETTPASRFNEEPDDLYFSPSRGMQISRKGKDRGSIAQDLKCTPVVDSDNQIAYSNRIVDNLDRMLERGMIDQDMYDAAREFQRNFERAGYATIKTTNLTGAGGGGASADERAIGDINARNFVHGVMELVGGTKSYMWLAIYWIIGHEKSMREVEVMFDEDRKVWTGFAKAGLYLMARDYRRRKNRSMKSGRMTHA